MVKNIPGGLGACVSIGHWWPRGMWAGHLGNMVTPISKFSRALGGRDWVPGDWLGACQPILKDPPVVWRRLPTNPIPTAAAHPGVHRNADL